MKKILIISLFCSSFGFADAELDVIVNKIQKERDSIGSAQIEKTTSPFVTVSKEKVEVIPTKKIIQKKKRKAVFVLNGLMNQKAFINGSWYKSGDTVLGFELRYIGRHGVVLTRDENGKQILQKVFMESSIDKSKKINLFDS